MTFEEARRKARYGHKDYIQVPANDGSELWTRLTTQSLKLALLRAGTQGKVLTMSASTAILHRSSWGIGINMLRNARHLGIPAA